jgi:hypothetical protein
MELTLERAILDAVGQYAPEQRGPTVASVFEEVRRRLPDRHDIGKYSVFLQMRAMMRDGLLTRRRSNPKAAYRWHITEKGSQGRCPDGGTCHHWCGRKCFRVQTCGPLSGVYPDDEWPAEVLIEHGAVIHGYRHVGDMTYPEVEAWLEGRPQ